MQQDFIFSSVQQHSLAIEFLMKDFVQKESILRHIWGDGDTVLLLFAGAAAEFALNKAVDWLYFTGNLPADPLKRLFSTVTYARRIVFASEEEAHRAIDQINAIHKGVEQERGRAIPQWAYRDVWSLLIDYSIRTHELLHRQLSLQEKEAIYAIFLRIGQRMQLRDLSPDYATWQGTRQEALHTNLLYSSFSKDLYRQYRKHLGLFRYWILLQAQHLLVPKRVHTLLGLGKHPFASLLLKCYLFSSRLRLKRLFKNLLIPSDYKKEIMALDLL